LEAGSTTSVIDGRASGWRQKQRTAPSRRKTPYAVLLLPETEFRNDGAVALDVLVLEVVQESTTLSDEL